MVLGNEISEAGSDNESVVPPTPQEGEVKGLQSLQIGLLLQMILQDAQTRLVFKAQNIIQSEIRLYIPTEDDLRYPEKLIGLCFTRCCCFRLLAVVYRAQTSNQIKEHGHEATPASSSIEESQIWYPSVQKTTWIISLLQEFVKVECLPRGGGFV